MIKVLSVGGSIIAPGGVDTEFLKKFVSLVRKFLNDNPDAKLILVVGGGAPARVYQAAYRDLVPSGDQNESDWIGIMATRLNARLLKAVFADLCPQDVVCDPTVCDVFQGRILVAAGWKPGFSTDNDAVLLAEKFGSNLVVNLSNIKQVYTDDPKKNPDAKPIDKISWAEFRKIIGDEWSPGKNVPFDPVASRRAQEKGISVICAGGTDIDNIEKILNDKDFFGTLIF